MNQTLTLVSGGPAPSGKGFEFTDSDGVKWWMPPEDRDTKASNEPVAKELIPLFGRAADYNVWVKDDGTAHMIFGKAKEKKGPVTAWRNTEVGARFEQDQMNRRTALMQAVEHNPGMSTQNALVIAREMYDFLNSVGAPAQADTAGEPKTEQKGLRRPAQASPAGSSEEAVSAAGSHGELPSDQGAGEEPPADTAPPAPTPLGRGVGSSLEAPATRPADDTRRRGIGSPGREMEARETAQPASAPQSPAPTPPGYDPFVALGKLVEVFGGKVAATKAARDAYGVGSLSELKPEQIVELTRTKVVANEAP